MRILLLTLHYAPDVNSTGLLMSQLAKGLAKRGHRVTVLTSFPHYDGFRIWDAYKGRFHQHSLEDGVDVHRLLVWATGQKQRLADRLLSYLSFNAVAAVTAALSRKRYDLVLCTNGSFFTGPTAAFAASLKGVPFVLNVQDMYPEAPMRAGKIRNPWIIGLMNLLLRGVYKRAAHVTVVAPSFRASLMGRGLEPARVSIIPNFVDVDFIRPLPRENAFSRRLGLHHKFVISHAGNVGYAYDLDTLLEAAARLRNLSDIVFLIVGDGVALPSLEEKARRMNLSNVRLLPFQPREDLPLLRATSDVQISLYKPRSAEHSMPSKVYEIMASGKPLLASAEHGSDVWNLIEAAGCGVCIEPQNAERLAEAILMLRADPGKCAEMGRRGRAHVERDFSVESVVDQYDQLLHRIATLEGGRATPAAEPAPTPAQ